MSDRTVAIIGGGFGGARLARELESTLPPDWRIELLSRENFITYNPLLPEVVGASLLPGHVVAPLRQMVKRAKVRMVNVSDIDLCAREIHYIGEGSGIVVYDHLVMACGQVANLDIIKGLNRYALPLKTLGDALFLRNRIISRLEQAELQADPTARRWLTSFVVLGGGFSGVEVAGELQDFLHAARRYYPGVQAEDINVHLIHSGDRLLPELSESLGRFTGRKMAANGITVSLNARAEHIDDRAVYLKEGRVIPAGTVICTIGTAPNPLISQLGLPTERGRLRTLPDMQVPGVTGLWALGDCAAVPNTRDGLTSPPTAQFADRQARTLAANIVAHIRGEKTSDFGYIPQGQLSSIGHNKAVAEFFGLRLAGFIAWLLWRGVYLLKIPTLGRKARLFLEWNWDMFFPPDISHFGYTRTRRNSVVRVQGTEEVVSKLVQTPS